MAQETLSSEELGRRIKAARELRGLSQTELNELFEADGLDKYAPARIERGELTMQRAQREALQRHLRVPERWLTAETVDEIVGLDGPLSEGLVFDRPSGDPSYVQVSLTAIRKDLDELLAGRREVEKQLGPLGRDPEAARDVLNWLAQGLAEANRDRGKRGLQSRRAMDRLAQDG